MTTLNLTNQTNIAGQVSSKIQTMKTEMDLRIPVWQKLPTAKKKLWVTSGKDPLMTLAWNTYKYLRDNFFVEVDSNG